MSADGRRTGTTVVTAVRDGLASRPGLHAVANTVRGRSAALRPAQHRRDGQADDVFFVIGSGRSGTTLVRRILMSSPHVHIPPELHVVGRMVATYDRYAHLPWDRVVSLCLAQLAFHPEFVRFEMDLGPVARALCRLPAGQRSFAAIIIAVLRAHAVSVGRDGATILGEKTPNTTEHVHAVHATIPAARFIHVVRNGLDVAASFAEADMFPLDVAARLWVRRTRITRRFAARHPEACLTVRYEDLVTDPEPVVRSLAAFLDLPPETLDLDRVDHVSAMVDVAARRSFELVGEPITSARVDRWRDRMDPDELRVAARIMGRELRHWGHDVVGRMP